jgi:small subunit ribosomal protein S2
MAVTDNIKKLMDAGVHFGHLTRKWNPNMAPYIFMERNGIHVIDLHKTEAKIAEASEYAGEANMPYVTERWPGGMLTNFVTIRKAIKKMQTIDKMKENGTFETLSKRERLQVDRQRAKLERDFGSVADMNRLPAALFIVDIKRENIAVDEAIKLGIPTFGMVDTNSDPRRVDYAIPGNDDASKSIAAIMERVTDGVKLGLSQRKSDKASAEQAKIDKKAAQV